ncbi:TrkH family potassium uptake protein [Thermodesulfobacteriota bacterium]
MHPRLVASALGALAAVLGLCMAAALPWSIGFSDGVHEEFLLVILCCVAGGGLVYRLFHDPDVEYGLRDGFAIVTLGWLMAGFLGALPYWFTGVLPSFVDALFESVSGFTTTGASVVVQIEELPRGILFWRSLTHWLGGMGIIVLSVAILPLLGVGGMAMFKAEVPSPVMDKLKPTVAATAKTLWKVYLLFTVVETLLLFLSGMTLFDALCHTFGTLATGGFATKNMSIGYYESPLINVIIVIFMMIAGINFTLHYQALNGNFKAYLRSRECRLYLIIFVGSVVFITWHIYGTAYDSFWVSLDKSSFQTASIMTTTGYATADWENWPWACQWLLLTLMFMGGCAGSTGGGMKCMRLIIVAKHVFRELSLLIHPRAVISLKIDRKVVDPSIINSILAFLGLFTGVWAVSTLLLVIMEIDVITAIGATTATLCNIGPGLNKVGAMDNYAWLSQPAKWLLIFNMLAGRLELYTVFVLMVPDFWRR